MGVAAQIPFYAKRRQVSTTSHKFTVNYASLLVFGSGNGGSILSIVYRGLLSSTGALTVYNFGTKSVTAEGTAADGSFTITIEGNPEIHLISTCKF